MLLSKERGELKDNSVVSYLSNLIAGKTINRAMEYIHGSSLEKKMISRFGNSETHSLFHSKTQ